MDFDNINKFFRVSALGWLAEWIERSPSYLMLGTDTGSNPDAAT